MQRHITLRVELLPYLLFLSSLIFACGEQPDLRAQPAWEIGEGSAVRPEDLPHDPPVSPVVDAGRTDATSDATSDASDAEAMAAFCVSYPERYCSNLFGCLDRVDRWAEQLRLGVASYSECLRTVSRLPCPHAEAVAAGRVTVDPERLEACVSDDGCDRDPSCTEGFTGAVDVGESCYAAEECGPDARCLFDGTGDRCDALSGVCIELKSVGESCSRDEECGGSANECWEGRCRDAPDPGGGGEVCTYSGEVCIDGFCTPDGCEPHGEVGEACENRWYCRSPLDCEDGVCVGFFAEGGRCEEARQCRGGSEGSVCLDGVCRRLASNAEPCRNDEDCRHGLACDAGVCRPPAEACR